MLCVHSLETPLSRETVATVGVFDGFHLGHRNVLEEVVRLGRELGAAPAVLTFSTHPDEVVGGSAPPQLCSLPHRLALLAAAGAEIAAVLPFDRTLREMPARDFAVRILVERLRCRALVMGFDSALGRNREGTFPAMAGLGRELGFLVRQAPPLLWQGRPVSASAIREAVRSGRLDLAWALLGRPCSILGPVIRGDGRGRELGFPTANLATAGLVTPPRGIYAGEAVLHGQAWPAVADLGVNPTFAGTTERLEAHLIDYRGPAFYGEELEVRLHSWLRPEVRFASVAELCRSIGEDIAACRALLAQRGQS